MTPQTIAFSYGGHATFPVRYGWLTKGLERLDAEGSFVPTTKTADDLGLGTKMVESLAYWLETLGLTQSGGGKAAPRTASPLSRLIFERDPYLEMPVTWWFLHLALCRREGTVWSWFFNDFFERNFDRMSCVEAFVQHTKSAAQRPAGDKTATKEVACLLSAYAARPGVDIVNPDDIGACPFRELGLVMRREPTGRFERTRMPFAVPAEAFLASVSLLSQDTEKNALSLREMANWRHGPGRILCAGVPAIEALVEAAQDSRHTRAETLAGERQLIVAPLAITEWLTLAYDRIESRT